MKIKSAIHGARAAADTKEAAKTAANSRSTQASKQAIAHAANVGVNNRARPRPAQEKS